MSKKLIISLVSGLLAGIAASLCCVGPLLLLLLGFGSAWISHLTALEPYRPVFIVMAIAALIIVYSQLYKGIAEQPCNGKTCAELPVNRLYKSLFWSIVMIVLALIASPYLIVLLYR